MAATLPSEHRAAAIDRRATRNALLSVMFDSSIRTGLEAGIEQHIQAQFIFGGKLLIRPANGYSVGRPSGRLVGLKTIDLRREPSDMGGVHAAMIKRISSMRSRPSRSSLWLPALLLAMPGTHALEAREITPPASTRTQVDLIGELDQPWQAGGAIVLYAAEDGTPRAGRHPAAPTHADEEKQRRAEHFALARKVNIVTGVRVPPMGLPLTPEQIELFERFAMTDAGGVWFREVADDTLRLFNQGYLEYHEAAWRRGLAEGAMPRLSELITGWLSEAGQFSQDAAPFRLFAYDGYGAMAAAASVRLGTRGFRCRFPISGELVDPFAVLSHEFGHTRYGDPRSAGQPLGEALTVERYENPVRLRNGFPPRTVYYLSVEPARAASWRMPQAAGEARPQPTLRFYCECPDSATTLHDCPAPGIAPTARGASAGERDECVLRWLAVDVDTSQP